MTSTSSSLAPSQTASTSSNVPAPSTKGGAPFKSDGSGNADALKKLTISTSASAGPSSSTSSSSNTDRENVHYQHYNTNTNPTLMGKSTNGNIMTNNSANMGPPMMKKTVFPMPMSKTHVQGQGPPPPTQSQSQPQPQPQPLRTANTVNIASSNPLSVRPMKSDDEEPRQGGGGRWTREEDAKLREGVTAIGATKWKKISEEYLGGRRSDVQCLHRWQKVLRPGLVKGPWTEEEDNMIRACIERKITKWSEIAERIPGRIGKQCRERWFNHLDPTIDHSAWTEEEEKVLVTAQATFGNRWCEIAKLLPGRPENAVKNRWNSAIRRKWQLKLGLTITDNKGKAVDPQPPKAALPLPLPALVPVVKKKPVAPPPVPSQQPTMQDQSQHQMQAMQMQQQMQPQMQQPQPPMQAMSQPQIAQQAGQAQIVGNTMTTASAAATATTKPKQKSKPKQKKPKKTDVALTAASSGLMAPADGSVPPPPPPPPASATAASLTASASTSGTTAQAARKPRVKKSAAAKASEAAAAAVAAANASNGVEGVVDGKPVKEKKPAKPRAKRAPKKDGAGSATGATKPRKPRQSKKKAAAAAAAAAAAQDSMQFHSQNFPYGTPHSNQAHSQHLQHIAHHGQQMHAQHGGSGGMPGALPIMVPPLDMHFVPPMSSAASPVGPLQWDFHGGDMNLDFSQADLASLGLDTDLFLQPGSTKHANQPVTTPSHRFVMQHQHQQAKQGHQHHQHSHAHHHQQHQHQGHLQHQTHMQHSHQAHMQHQHQHQHQLHHAMDTPNSAQKRAANHPFSQSARRQGGARTAPGNALISPLGPMPNWDTLETNGNLDRGMASLTLSMLESDFDNLGPGPKTDDSFGVNWAAGALNLPFSPT
ncbi:Transcription factor MYB3R-4 [Hondaea fermentalgiana]|uniref:Transcription factor MYB3R-4 n=1 Tax=Hondaea fermentalgiana TaxID=2315210 RepID=A0A2R5G768_9STRA|nr:Transcription factor MYB3R-4 [Hondaea fermentalgiana]|eukprot:GBG26897.1 Transcription factor MYB3R-4 [Hondaea fermentalgiana]